MKLQKKIEQLFKAALDIEPANRLDFLKKACAGDNILLEEVLALLTEDDTPDDFLDGNVTDNFAVPMADPAIGEHIGVYKIIRKIGKGGMGTVYLAERTDGTFERKVALKIIKSVAVSRHIIKRFNMERQILARLQHPNIARLFGGGITKDGVPWYSMEYIEGDNIDAYCDHHKLSIIDRLSLFKTVCDAISYAHRNLIVHRDIKPANIIVQKDGVVKLLDFGIAKILDDEGKPPETANLTMTRQQAFTPEYASPEQISGKQAPIATDIYQLGLNLYELLTGRRPYSFESSSFVEIERIICHTGIDKPSTVFLNQKNIHKDSHVTDIQEISMARGTDPVHLKKMLSGDLDNICLMALRKEPERRYVSVDHFAADIEKHLNGRPVMARPATLKYRSQKFISRHKTGFVSSLLAFSVIIYLLFQLIIELDRANHEAEKANRVAEYILNLFGTLDPNELPGKEVSALQLLDTGVENIEKELSGQPDVMATMMFRIGIIYMELGKFDKAISLHLRSLKIRRQLYGEENENVAESLFHLADAYLNNREIALSEKYLREALNIRRKLFNKDDKLIARTLYKYSKIDDLNGNYSNALKHQQEALSIYKKLYQPPNLILAENTQNLASILFRNHRYAEAESLFIESIENYKQLYPAQHPAIALCYNDFGVFYEHYGDYSAAIKMHRQALEIYQNTLDHNHPYITSSMQNLAFVLNLKGQYQEADKLMNKTLQRQKERFGENHYYYALTLKNYAIMLIQEGNYKKALSMLQNSLPVYVAQFGSANWRIAEIKYFFAQIYIAMSQYTNAEKFLKEAISGLSKQFPENHIRVCKAYNALATLYLRKGQINDAGALYKKTLDLQMHLLPPLHPFRAQSLTGLGAVYVLTNKNKEAESLLREALKIRRHVFTEDHILISETESILGACLLNLGKFDEAEKWLKKSYKNLAAKRGEQDYFTIKAKERLEILNNMRNI